MSTEYVFLSEHHTHQEWIQDFLKGSLVHARCALMCQFLITIILRQNKINNSTTKHLASHFFGGEDTVHL